MRVDLAEQDFYRAQVQYLSGRFSEARLLAQSAHDRFATLHIPSKRALALVLLARIALETGEVDEAVKHAELILWLSQQPGCDSVACYSIAAQVAEYRGDVDSAESLYRRASERIETQRSSLEHDALRVTFFKGKFQIYEALVRLALRNMNSAGYVAQAYNWCERSKSRGLMDLLSGNPTTIENVQQVLPNDCSLLEYFIARNEVLAFVISRQKAVVKRHLCTVHRIQHLHERLLLQMDKFQLNSSYPNDPNIQLYDGTDLHLEDLYTELIQPVASELDSKHLIIVPHGILHHLPFHAFLDGGQRLIDRHTISYAPSASVLVHSMQRETVKDAQPLIIGVADERAPRILEEIALLRELVRPARIFCGEDATGEVLRREGIQSDFLHIATHATFHAEDPMSSSLKLGDGAVTASDLQNMTCRSNLVTLSGCKSGVNHVGGADELLGLARGFLSAGAQSLLLSLWDVNDRSTSAFMHAFYRQWLGGRSKAEALQDAIREIRAEYPHPYFWAPFYLVGNPA